MPKPWEKYGGTGKPWEKYAGKTGPSVTDTQADRTERFFRERSAEAVSQKIDERLPGFGRAAAQAAFGFGDEALAFARSAFGEDYDAALADERRELREMDPAFRFGVEGLTAFLVPGGLLAKARSLPAVAGVGAGTGLAYGFGGAEGGEGGLLDQAYSRAQQALPVALMGGTLGAGARMIGALGGAVGRGLGETGLGRRMRGRAPGETRNVHGVIADDLRASRLTPDRVETQMGALSRTGEDPRLYDAGRTGSDPIKRTARSLAMEPKVTTGGDVAAYIERRGRNARGRVKRHIAELTGKSTRHYEDTEALISQARARSAPHYAKADPQKVVVDADLAELLDTPALRRGVNLARDAAKNRRANIPEFKDGEVVTIADLDRVKKAVDRTIKNLTKKKRRGDLASDEEVLLGSMQDAREAFVTRLREESKDYARALDAFSGPARARELQQHGKAMWRGEADLSEAAIAKLSPPEREFLRAGFIDAFVKDIEGSGAAVTRLLKDVRAGEGVARKLRLMFPDEQRYREFLTRMKAESQLAKAQGIPPAAGSQTALRQEDRGRAAKNVAASAAAAVAMPGSNHALMLTGAWRRFFRGLMDKPTGLSPEEFGLLSRVYTERYGPETAGILNRSVRSAQPPSGSAAPALTAGVLAGSQ